MKKILFLAILFFPAVVLADYEIEVRTPFTCSANPEGREIPTERFDNKADAIVRTEEMVEATQAYVTQRCYYTHRYNPVASVPDPIPDPAPTPDPIPDPPSIFGLLYTDLVRAPVGAPITAWCADGTTETQPAAENMVLCGDQFSPTLTAGQIIFASPPMIPQGGSDDVILLSAGTYTGTVNCNGKQFSFCGDSNKAQVIGDVTGERPVLVASFHCGADASGTSGLTLANVDAAVACANRGTKSDMRFVNLYCHDRASGNSGACGNWSNTAKLRVFGFKTERTGVLGQNNAHSLYHGGRGHSFDVEFGWLDLSEHVGGRCFQVYGHHADELLDDIYIHDSKASNCQGNASFLISGTDGQLRDEDGQRVPAEDHKWIGSVRFERNTFENKAVFKGTNLNGGQDWTADGNTGPINARMGGESSTWIKVTNNIGEVTGTTR